MLDSKTKRRIDTCRDILVGKVPDPKSQVEQITVALIYKFMDDMDLEAEELGGQRRYFTEEFERYRWAKLVAPGVSGQDMLNTYSEALTKMVENERLPALFRQIFRNAFLPYRDPETLRSFLREIDTFTYDHSERLGDAFEYLLSVLGSQGDAGQFRTPRHIIDFMVEIIDPKKDEVILDPACGTAGFLISAYKHILKKNSTEVANGNGERDGQDVAEQTLESPLRFPGDLLTQDDRKRLAQNIIGYDISPDMVRLSLVNLYLHGFPDPKIEEYDTLTSEDKWTEMADVILANPPFMSPKGGIKPHTKFQVQSKRSEVLFVDYIAEHLTPNGRAAIVVPEGIIFQSQSAYVSLRKMLVENHLAAVISLPAGVFNPYSGVKTSILILDRAVAKASKHVAFFKIENDGFQLGAQRKAQKGSQLPKVKGELTAWMQVARGGAGEQLESVFGYSVEREVIGEDGEFNLSGERYRPENDDQFEIPRVPIGEICTLNPPKREVRDLPGDTLVSFVPMADLREWDISFCPSEAKALGEIGNSYTYFADNDVLLAKVTPCFENGKAGIAKDLDNGIGFGSSEFYVLRSGEQVLPEWVYRCVTHEAFRAQAIPQMTGTGGLQRVPRAFVERFKIPLPPLEVQREIVAEIEGYQRVIDGARAVIANYRPHIPIDPEWGSDKLKNLIDTVTPPLKLQTEDYKSEGEIPIIDQSKELIAAWTNEVQGAIQPGAGLVIFGDHTCVVKFVDQPFVQGADGIKILKAKDGVLPRYLAYYLRAHPLPQDGYRRHFSKLKEWDIRLPSPNEQAAIVQELDAEQAIVDGNRELITRFEKKIEAAIARVWGEAKADDEAA
ncbi:restriction endonuclease subunit M/S [Roseovarius spongiae]|uniref:site-specific DNA-methyltransferase (adenine-specific) n=1 Tax=Roseovarius spongiae TaxID=2320272 RepID=A0A3A8ASD5_9RHOB|nr:N-6 DNA methylase [Roseovarius spongiae]RKF14062.1 restriction endonuclease subunit M/S [Roseovarius spongiae]